MIQAAKTGGPSLWRRGPFLRLWGGSTISGLGDQISLLALPWLVLQLTHSPFQLGIIAALEMGPFLLFGLLAGVYADRSDRRAVMLAADLVRFGVLASVPLAAFLHALTMVQLYVVAYVAGSARVWFEAASFALLPSLVETEQLVGANSRLEITQGVSALVGPSLGGLLIKLFGAANAILADALSFVISAAALLSLGPRRAVQSPAERGWRAQLLAGVRYAFKYRVLLETAIVALVLNLLFSAIQAVFVFYAQHELHLDAAATGLLFGLAGIGPIVFGVLAPRFRRRFRTGQVIVAAVVSWGPLIGALDLAPMLPATVGFVLVAVIQALTSGFAILFRIFVISYDQAVVPQHLLSRVSTSLRFIAWGAIPVGALAGGAITQVVGVRWLIAGVGSLLLLEALAVLAFSEVKRV